MGFLKVVGAAWTRANGLSIVQFSVTLPLASPGPAEESPVTSPSVLHPWETRARLMVGFESEFHVVVLQEPRRLYRGCFGPDRIEQALTSNYENGRNPHPADLRATVLHMAVSMFEDKDLVLHLAQRRPDRVGDHVATVELQPGFGVCIADTSGPGHWSVWGRPVQLLEFVADVERA